MQKQKAICPFRVSKMLPCKVVIRSEKIIFDDTVLCTTAYSKMMRHAH